MFRGQRVVCIIPARGGSKGLPGKNVKPLCGRPLIAWTIAAALGAAHVDDVVVTTDDDGIAAAAQAAGARVPFRRPAELASDDARMVDVIAHALDAIATEPDGEPGYLLLLQPTSPLRTSADVDDAFARLDESGGRAVVSVCEAEHSPLWIGQLPDDGRMAYFIEHTLAKANRQELGRFYRLNGSIYLAEAEYWRGQGGFLGEETYAFVMSQEDSVDVDSPLDFEIAACLLSKRQDGACQA